MRGESRIQAHAQVAQTRGFESNGVLRAVSFSDTAPASPVGAMTRASGMDDWD